jgi:2-dehydro-3-deoxyphosphogluconate aldolase/(4S)-4-hydroxy-2-oxoglutarate aldolase
VTGAAEPPPPSAVLDRIAASRLLPVLVLDGAAAARGVGAALTAAGLGLAEVTLRTAGALAALEALASVPDLCAGAGTVLTTGQVDAAVAAGARFVVSPGLDAAVVRRCRELSVPVFPGVATPTELMAAIGLGLDTVKLFPAGMLGGAPAVAALAGPFPGIRFIPTGGIDARSAPTYLSHPSVLAVGGSWMAPADLVRTGDWEGVRARATAALAAATDVEEPR